MAVAAAASAAGVPGVVGAAGQQPHVIVPSIIKPPADRLDDDCGLQSDGFGKREITLLPRIPLPPSPPRLILALPSINIAWQIMGRGARRVPQEGRRGEGSGTVMVSPLRI